MRRRAKDAGFTDAENDHRSDVVVIGAGIAEALFPSHNAIGKNLLIDGVNYTILGVLEKRKEYLIGDDSQDKIAKVPYRTYQKHHPQDHEGFIAAMAYPGKMAQAQDEATSILRIRRHVPPNKPDDFGIDSADAIADQFRQIMSMTFLMTIVVSSIGLLVGGVGVMNIMLMSVTERTHEIGVRKAIGAKRGDIIRQFLTEAVVLTGAGRGDWSRARHVGSEGDQPDLYHASNHGTAVGGDQRSRGGDGRGIVLRHVSGGEGSQVGSGGSPALRVGELLIPKMNKLSPFARGR